MTEPHLMPTSPPLTEQPGQPLPPQLGRYRVVALLGEGGFGRVYRAIDEQLQRLVAIKVPHPRRVVRAADVEAYLKEARILASLDHPGIVPVHDVGRTDDGLCYVVSKLIDGSDLAEKMHGGGFTFAESAGLVCQLAEALHHAHRQGLVHRDIKPANILLDGAGKPYVADFGLVLCEEDFGKHTGLAGTPAYMSPEQARGEGHRVDGRSDLFSLGVVFYELLTGRRPFRGDSISELLEQIATREPRPLRQLDETIPRELERICLKALAKRASERYQTALDLAEDVRHFLAQQQAEPTRKVVPGDVAAPASRPAVTPSADPRPLRIVPKGLRSFDARDADFFLELLPGPRDRDGLPDSLRFWKTRIEEPDAEHTFAVGLLYGPSGCGKSSLIKAGLLPRLSEKVSAVYVEATADDTETRLLNGLRKRCPGLPQASLLETLTALRLGEPGGVSPGRKMLLVLDQFEQWLHANRERENTELVQALRQCDGVRVQCVVMVRDDFWMAATRFMRDLEIRLVEGHNSAAADLFPPRHAEKVLTAFGRAFGALPEGEPAPEQKRFLEQAVAGLAQEGKVVSVRLALFTEMMKARAWTPSTLSAVGGAQGIGAAFLEETFSATTAPPEHRYHQKAARAVLKALLPESGTDIKGHMRSHGDLLAASGYAGRPRDFDDLLRILDGEVRLITPTDPEGHNEPEASATETSPPVAHASGSSERFYQLTHDYLVPSLRDWLTRKQKETRRGRAELLLADRAAVWTARPENRQLPSLPQWLGIRWLTRKQDWTPPQQKMMGKAGRYHLVRGLAVTVVLLLWLGIGWVGHGQVRSRALLDNLLRATTEDVPAVVADMGSYRLWLDEPLRQAYREAEASGDARKQLHASLALLPVDPNQVEYLLGRLLAGEPQEVGAIRSGLHSHSETVSPRLWSVLEDAKSAPGQRLRAASALALYAPADARWDAVSERVVEGLLAEHALVVGRWAEVLRPVGKTLLVPLSAALLKEERSGLDRSSLARIYQSYAEEPSEGFALLEKVLAEQPGDVRRQANAAVALAAAGRWEKVLPLLRQSPDPTLRSYLIDRLAPGGVEAKALLAQLKAAGDDSVRQALLLALGELGSDRLPESQRELLVPRLTQLYEDHDAGVHGAAAWLLRQWGRQPGEPGASATGVRRWYVSSQKHTMVIVPQPKEWFLMGEGDGQHRRRIGRSFAIAAREVTVAQFQAFRKNHEYFKHMARTLDCPVHSVSWYDAAAYCNWLSQQEKIPNDQWCYLDDGKELKPAPDFLKRTGYRLPTEAEWEFACRAGSTTGWSHGNDDVLLQKYARYHPFAGGKSHPVGSLRPNLLGLFDMHGNAWEWCQDWYPRFEKVGKDTLVEDKGQIEYKTDKNSSLVWRGGSFVNYAEITRSAYRNHNAPAYRVYNIGFRPARTIVNDGPTPLSRQAP